MKLFREKSSHVPKQIHGIDVIQLLRLYLYAGCINNVMEFEIHLLLLSIIFSRIHRFECRINIPLFEFNMNCQLPQYLFQSFSLFFIERWNFWLWRLCVGFFSSQFRNFFFLLLAYVNSHSVFNSNLEPWKLLAKSSSEEEEETFSIEMRINNCQSSEKEKKKRTTNVFWRRKFA